MTTRGATMTTSVTYPQQAAAAPRVHPGIQLVLGLGILVVLSLPLLLAEPGPLTSDESIYVSEGLNLALGKGYTYTTGELVHHRGPVFPALLAADFSVAGFSLDHAGWGLRPFGYHLTSVLLHMLNVVLACRVVALADGRVISDSGGEEPVAPLSPTPSFEAIPERATGARAFSSSALLYFSSRSSSGPWIMNWMPPPPPPGPPPSCTAVRRPALV